MTTETLTRAYPPTDRGPWQAPLEADFEEEDTDFLAAPGLHNLADTLIDTFEVDLAGASFRRSSITYFWKKEGGDKMGKCQKATGLVRYLSSGSTYVIWLAADHCRGFSLDQTKALLYHELRHIHPEGGIRKHEIEAFAGEIEHFGIWRPDMEGVAKAVQLALELR